MKWQPFLTAAAAALMLAACSTARRDASTAPVTAQEAETEKPPGVGAARTTWGPERDPEIRRLLKERFEAAVSAYVAEQRKLESGKSTTYSVLGTSRVLAEAEVELAETPEQVFAAWESELRRCTEMVAENNRRIEVGALAPLDGADAEACCNAARTELLRARRNFQKDERAAWGAIRRNVTSSAVFPPAWAPERDPDIRRGLKGVAEYACAAYAAEQRKLESGKSTTFAVLAFARLVDKAELELAETPEQVLEILGRLLENNRKLETESKKRIEVGALAPQEDCLVHAGCAAAEIDLLRARRQFQQDQRDSGGVISQKTPTFAFLPAALAPERDPEIRRLLKEGYNAAAMAYQAEKKKLESGKSRLETVISISKQLTEAESELAETPEQVMAAWENELNRCKELVSENERRIQVGALAPLDQYAASIARLSAEIEILRAKRQFQIEAPR